MKHPRFRCWQAAAFAVALAAILACWAIPFRLATDEGHGWYTFGYSSDEYAYSQRIDVLPAGASDGNVFNHVSDPNVISPYFLDRLLRGFLNVTGMGVIAFFWTWRFLFPVGLLAACIAISSVCLRRHSWSSPLAVCAGSAGLLGVYLTHYVLIDHLTVYFLGMDYVPIFMMLNRLPANVEFLLGGFFIWSLLRWCRRGSTSAAVIMCLAVATAFYLRPYLALHASVAMTLTVGWMLVCRKISLRECVVPTLVFAAAMAPWLYILLHNRHLPAHVDQMARMFLHPFPYMVHPLWYLYVIIAAGVLAAVRWIDRWGRVAIASCAVSLCALPFYAGLTPVAREMLSNDRFSCFYLPLVLATVVLLAAGRMQAWRGRTLASRFHRTLAVTTTLAAIAVAAVLWISLRFQFETPFHPAFVQRDQRYFQAYEWVRTHTPEDALFLVDDGFDRTSGLATEFDQTMAMTRLTFFHFDFFSHIARRQRVFAELEYVYYLSEPDLTELTTLHWGTFGLMVNGKAYVEALKRIRPGFILWRKTPPIFQPDAILAVPRGKYGERLQQFATTVYNDEYCQIWQMDYTNKTPNKNDSGPAAK